MNKTEIKIADLQALLSDLRNCAASTAAIAQSVSNPYLRDYALSVSARTGEWADELHRIVGEA